MYYQKRLIEAYSNSQILTIIFAKQNYNILSFLSEINTTRLVPLLPDSKPSFPLYYHDKKHRIGSPIPRQSTILLSLLSGINTTGLVPLFPGSQPSFSPPYCQGLILLDWFPCSQGANHLSS
jgi:hypothetical protein